MGKAKPVGSEPVGIFQGCRETAYRLLCMTRFNIASQRHHAPKGVEEVGNIAQTSQRRSEAAVGDKA